MKLTSVFLLFLVIKTKASFFDDFRGAMSSVEHAFGKLMNDVITDVKTTVHCTILAVEQVLAINGVMKQPLSNNECYKDDKNGSLTIGTRKNSRNLYSAKDIAQEISTSISKVNKSLSHILDNNGHERLEDVKRVLKNESKRLTEVSSLLRQELEKISRKMKKKFESIDLNSHASSLESVWKDMKLMYEAEQNDKNISTEVGEVLNEALEVLHIKKIGEVKSDKDKIKAIIQELEHESNTGYNPNNIINRELSQWIGDRTALGSNLKNTLIHEGASRSFKDVATSIFRHSDKIRKNIANYITGTPNSFVNSNLLPENTQTETDGTQVPSVSNDFSSFGATNSDDHIKVINKALDIIKNTAHTQTLLDNFFAKNEGANVFDSSNLFGFKK